MIEIVTTRKSVTFGKTVAKDPVISTEFHPCKILVDFSDEISQRSMKRNKREILENIRRIFREKLRRFLNEIS